MNQTILIQIVAMCFLSSSSIANAQCNYKNKYLISSTTNQKFPILSIRDCFGLDIKEEMKHFPDKCLTYKQAEKLNKRHKKANISGYSIIEIGFKGSSIFLERYETAFASPSLSFDISRKLDKERQDSKIVCKIPYPRCEYAFEPDSGILTTKLPPSYESKIKSDQSNREEIELIYYGAIVKENLVENGCKKGR